MDTLLLRRRSDWRQLAIVATYQAAVLTMYFVPSSRTAPLFVLACGLSFLNSVVIHNHLHQGIFHSRALNRAFRYVLSFGSLYPASANVASHNLVHHHFDDDGQPDWADPRTVSFRWHLLNLLHFPNVAGPDTFAGVSRWALTTRLGDFRRQYRSELAFALGTTALLLARDPWAALFFIVMPQLWGARGILRINLIQHDACDVGSEWNHSRNFVGRGFNWVMCNNGYHTIHHNRAGLHWSDLPPAHERECTGRMHPSLDEPSMALYLLRTFLLTPRRPATPDLAAAERRAVRGAPLAPRERLRAEAEAASLTE